MNLNDTAKSLREHFPDAIVREIDFSNEKTIEVKKERLLEIFDYLRQIPEPGFEVLMDLTAVDIIEPLKETKVVYLLHNPNNMLRLRITVFTARDEPLPSVTQIWEGADWYEREIFDLFGVKFDNHPDLKRILMPDDWKGHPLRRDYALTEEPVEFKHGVKPKIPSQIISYGKSKEKS